uniref:Uncharacterized protein n=1 Tax=Rhizophora mucronata TaxID=61149 RepID=A0A2P2MSR9_RHIMU
MLSLRIVHPRCDKNAVRSYKPSQPQRKKEKK